MTLDDYRALLDAPPKSARGFTRWWWYGCCVEKDEILRELDFMKEAGIGGVELQILYPVQADDPEGYVHEGHIVPGKGHWMDGKDAAAVPWMAKYTRNPYPKKVVWVQCDVTKEYFYWLGVPAGEAKKGKMLQADIDGNTVTIGDCDYSSVRIYLNEKMVDLGKPVTVVHDGATLFEGMLTPSDALRKETLYTRNDLSYSFPCMVEVQL